MSLAVQLGGSGPEVYRLEMRSQAKRSSEDLSNQTEFLLSAETQANGLVRLTILSIGSETRDAEGPIEIDDLEELQAHVGETIEIDPSRLSDTSDASPGGTAAMSKLLQGLPRGEVSIGDTWTRDSGVALPGPGGLPIDVRTRVVYTFGAVRACGGDQIAELTWEGGIDADPYGAESDQFRGSGSLSGRAFVSLTHQRLIRSVESAQQTQTILDIQSGEYETIQSSRRVSLAFVPDSDLGQADAGS